MFDADLIVAFVFMSLLFLRQISILKQANKINYAPLMIGVGAISSVIHFIIHPEVQDVLLLLRESFFPLLVALFFYLIMNILHQTQERENAKTQAALGEAMVLQMAQLKEFAAEIETKLILSNQEEHTTKESLREQFKHDLKALDAIATNQAKFLEKFDELETWHKTTTESFENFTSVKLPELDSVVHKHIDLLRIAEQEHFNKITATLQRAMEQKNDFKAEFGEVIRNVQELRGLSSQIADAIVGGTLEQLAGVSKAFENQLLMLKSHAEALNTSLFEDENRLGTIKNHSEMIMKQMVLSSKKMGELQERSNELENLYVTMRALVADVEAIKADYVKSQAQLSLLSKEIRNAEDEHLAAMKEQVDALSENLTRKIEDSLDKLHEHYHIASEDITQSVKVLAKKAQLSRGYAQLEN
ncbi:MAG: hypothetical protein AB7U24_03460 [Sulfurimonadaceae bacterium]